MDKKVNVKKSIIILAAITIIVCSFMCTQELIAINYIGKEKQAEISMQAIANKKAGTSVQTDQNIQVEIMQISGEEELNETSDIYEGQGIAYTTYITNVGEEALNNVHVKATNQNAIYVDYVTREEQFVTVTKDATYIEENPELEAKEFDIEKIEPGERVTLNYQVVAKEVDGEAKLTNVLEISSDELESKTYESPQRSIKQAKIKTKIRSDYPENVAVLSKGTFHISMYVKNLSDKKIKEAILELPVTENFRVDPTRIVYIEDAKYVFMNYEDGIVRFKIEDIEPGEEQRIPLELIAASMEDEGAEAKSVTLYCQTCVNEETYISNKIYREIEQAETKIVAEQSSDWEGEEVETKDKFEIKLTVQNEGAIDANLSITDKMPKGLEIKGKASLVKGEETKEISSFNNTIMESISIKPNEKAEIIIPVEVDALKVEGDTVSNVANIKGRHIDVTTNEIAYKVTKSSAELPPAEIEIPEVKEEQGKTDIELPNTDKDPSKPSDNENKEPGKEQNTNQNSSSTNSNTSSNNQSTTSNKNEKFDLKLNKYITKIQVKDKSGVRSVSYDNQSLAKIEIAARKLSESKVTIEYKIAVTNEGNVPGYVKSIVDYIPADLTFDAKTNKGWSVGEDKNLYYNGLENQTINPGETKTVTLTLEKQMNNNNVGTTTNIAEIASATNKSSIKDTDSIPGNKKDGEDDMSKADVIISINTGKIVLYISIITIAIAILAGGIYSIKKKVL